MDSLTTLNTYSAQSVPYTDETLGSATLTNRYQINGVIDTAVSVMENLEKISSAAGSWLSYDIGVGKWGVVINKSGTSVASFNNSNILGSISVSGAGLKDLYNTVRVEFPNRDIRDASDFVSIEIPAGERNANELNNTLNLAYDIINEPVQAQLLGFIELKQSRVDLLITFETDYSKINLQAGDIIDVTNSQFSFSAKLFRIITIAEKQGDGAITIEITALEYDSGVYTTADLSRYTRTDSTGIITIGSIGTPGTPVVTKYERDSRPRIVVTSTAPTGIVEAMEFWRTTDVLLSESNRSYQLIGTQKPTGGGTYSSGDTVTFELDTLNASDFFIKTRGINDLTVGQFSTPSGLVEYVPEQTTDAIDPNTKITDLLGNVVALQGLYTLITLLDDLLAGITGKSIWDRIKDLFQESTGINLNTPNSVSAPITISDEGVLKTNQLTSINFVGSGVTVTNTGGAVTATITGGAGSGLSVVNTPEESDTVAWNGTAWVAVEPCCPITWPTGYAPGYVAPTPTCYLTFNTRYPPDRTTQVDPLTGASSDLAPITGSYYLVMGAGGATTFHGPVSAGSGDIKLYKSDGTLVETKTASQLIFDKNVVEIPFSTRTLKTDYYIIMDEGVIAYCDCVSPAITAATGSGAWNFNTPAYSTTAYTVTGSNFTAPNSTIPTVSAYSPSGINVCPNGDLTITWSTTVLKNVGNIYIKRYSDDVTAQTIDASTATGSGATLNYGALSSLSSSTQYYIQADAGIVKSNNGDCFQQGLSAAITKGSNKTFTTYSGLSIIGFVVDSDPPIASDPTRQKVNPQSNIGIQFNRSINLHSTGTITLNSSGGVHQTFDVADVWNTDKVSELIWISGGDTLYINPTTDMDLDTTYWVLFSAGCVIDSCNTVFSGLSDVNTVRFKTDAGPVSSTPAFDGSGSINQTGIVMDFDRTVVPSTGQLKIYDASDNLIASVDATDPSVSITEI